MTALEYMERQVKKHLLNYDRELERGVPEEMLTNIALKTGYYMAAAEALRNFDDFVRCKECKHWSDGVAGCTDHVKCCKIGYYFVGENGYCVYGERKDNES